MGVETYGGEGGGGGPVNVYYGMVQLVSYHSNFRYHSDFSLLQYNVLISATEFSLVQKTTLNQKVRTMCVCMRI